MKISVSYLSSNFDDKKTIELINNTDADFIHVDLMDGIFVENNNFQIEEIIQLLSLSKKDLDIHLMVDKAEKYIDLLSTLKPKYITFHIESNSNIEELIKHIKYLDVNIGIALNPETKISDIKNFLDEIDLVLIMTVVPGKGGQNFMENQIDKIKQLSLLRKKYDFILSVDGGINNQTISKINDYVDIVVSGSYICKSNNFQNQINMLKY